MQSIETALKNVQPPPGATCRLTFTFLVLAFLLPFSLVLATESDITREYRFSRAEILNSQEIELYPTKVAVDGLLWGTSLAYAEGMFMVKVRCSVEDSIITENAEGEEVESYASRYRVELYRFQDDEWQYLSWYRFQGVTPRPQCQAFMDTARLATAAQPFVTSLTIRRSGPNHRNLIDDWNIGQL